MQLKKSVDLITWLLLIAIPILCIITFLLPMDVQDALKARTDNWNLLTFLTSVFVHGSIEHLLGNIVTFGLFGFLLYIINKKSNREKFLLYSLLLVIILLPIIYNIVFALVFSHQSIVSFGLSLVVGGVIGLVVPSVIVFLRDELKRTLDLVLFSSSLLFLTASTIAFPYVWSALYNLTVFVTTFSIGLVLFLKELGILINFARKSGKEYRNKIIIAILIIVVYFVSLFSLFPTSIVLSQGNIVNIFAHYFGLFFGIITGIYTIGYKTF